MENGIGRCRSHRSLPGGSQDNAGIGQVVKDREGRGAETN